MNALPPLRACIADALRLENKTAKVEAIARLADAHRGYLETLQIAAALDRVASGPVDGYPIVRIALLSATTVNHLVPALRVAGLRRGLWIEAMVGGFGQYRAELMAPAQNVVQFRPDVVVLALSARTVLTQVPLGDHAAERQLLDSAETELRTLWRAAREQIGANIVVQQTFLDVFEPVLGNHDQVVAGTPSRLVSRLNARLFDAAGEEGVLVLDACGAAARDGLDQWYDVARWLQGKMEIAPGATSRWAEILIRLLLAQRGRSSKCLVLDLDNTLWGGVVGDVGIAGLVLGEGSARGEAHLALQRYALSLKRRGVVLAVCSKNDPRVADDAFRRHPEMVLRRDDIACFVANWADKAENLRQIADTLNLGLDSLVFVDDNPSERARIRGALPMVAVPELPADPSLYVRCLVDGGHFEAIRLTDEDLQRADQYVANARREAFRVELQSNEEFLRSLGMVSECGLVRPMDVPRVAQLINKTNQFNTTGRRRSEQEVAALVDEPRWSALQYRLSDRFGDNGLVSVLVLAPAQNEPDALEIDTWVMSCRVFGRGLEVEAMNEAIEVARRRGAHRVYAMYRPTPRNGIIAELFQSLGFNAVGEADTAERRFVLAVDTYVARPTSIVRKRMAYE